MLPQSLQGDRLISRLLVPALLVLHAALLAGLTCTHSPVVTEVPHLPSGISHWEFSRFDLYRVNPPLVRMVAALPVLLADPQTNWDSYDLNPTNRSDYILGRAFVEANGPRTFWLYTLGRLACIPFSLIGAYACYRWASVLYGPWSGLVACLFWCLCPNILGHAALIMPDVPAAALGLLACYAFWTWLREPRWANAINAGLLLGLAELTKTTLILFYAIWPFLYLLSRLRRDRVESASASGPASYAWRRELSMSAGILLLSLLVLNLGYGFEGSFQRLGDFTFQSRLFTGHTAAEAMSHPTGNRFADSRLAALPVPVPKNYLQGIDTQQIDFEQGKESYLAGQWSDRGWWYFYLYAAAVKLPLGLWAAAGLSVVTVLLRWHTRATWRDELVLLVPLAVFFAVVSKQTGFTIHFRYVFPAFPFAFVLASRWAADFAPPHRVARWLGAVAASGLVLSSLAVYPHSLAYFNELAGGPTNGPNYLLDSNLDWGQDLWFLRRWIASHPEAQPLRIAYFGAYTPETVGLPRTSPPATTLVLRSAEGSSEPTPGWYAISVNLLFDRPGLYRHFRAITPVARVGYSIYVYQLTPEEAAKIRRELASEEKG